jgi:muramoyltetrapeptide carboxypeptidase
LVADPEIRGIIFARGGHGVLRILPGIDWSLLKRYPRPYVGYSDLTPFLLQVVQRLGLVAFHGPMVAADLARGLLPEERDSLIAALTGRLPLKYSLPGYSRQIGAASGVGGTSEVGTSEVGETLLRGTLLGGCLSMLEATLGTPYAPSLAGALLFVEDIAEPYYRLDRMLTHLRLSDSLLDIKGIVFGHLIGGRIEAKGRQARRGLRGWRSGFRGRRGRGGASDQALDHSLPKRLMEAHCLPYAWGLDAGHGRPNLTLPLGLEATIQVGREGKRLCIGEGR